MRSEPFGIRLDTQVLAALDGVRGDMARSTFINGTLARALKVEPAPLRVVQEMSDQISNLQEEIRQLKAKVPA